MKIFQKINTFYIEEITIFNKKDGYLFKEQKTNYFTFKT